MLKFKRWLIHKLGGYMWEERYYPIIEHIASDIHTIRAAYTIDPHLMEWEDYDKSIKQCLMRKLMECMHAENYINFYSDTDENGDKIVYAEIKVAKGE